MSLRGYSRVLVHVLGLRDLSAYIEPLFISLTLLDLNARCRISESFHVDLNSQDFSSWIPQMDIKAPDIVTRIQRALFSVPNDQKRPNIVLLVKVSVEKKQKLVDPPSRKLALFRTKAFIVTFFFFAFSFSSLFSLRSKRYYKVMVILYSSLTVNNSRMNQRDKL